jgi:hypothetical protein
MASCRVVEAASGRMRPSAARPGSPQEGPARPRRDPRESGGAARGRRLWTHRGERLPDATTAPHQADRGEGRPDGSQAARQRHHHAADPRLHPEQRRQHQRAGPRTRRPQPHRGSLESPPGRARPMDPTVSAGHYHGEKPWRSSCVAASPCRSTTSSKPCAAVSIQSCRAVPCIAACNGMVPRLASPPTKPPSALSKPRPRPASSIHTDVKYLPPLNRRRS